MFGFLNAKLDSDEDDEDYVPKETSQKPKEPTKEDILRAEKKRKEAEAIWKQMNEEEPPKKIKKEDIVPVEDNAQKKEEKKQEKKDKDVDDELMKEAKAALEAMKKTKAPVVQEKLRFAGEVYTFQKKASEKDLKRQEKEDRAQLKGRQGGLDAIMQRLQGPKTINSIDKSKKDWSSYVEKNNLEKVLDQNRKDGYLGKKKFMEVAEKAERSSKKASFRTDIKKQFLSHTCLLYTSPSPRDLSTSRMPSSA
eukprot:TRINITY_DN11266_c0_g1_i1.p1 TRINITY_DN11266_c0_g1~~TRINITY_DN11266_c0_g1_i1.p1  ORF type:complete len:251 (+),score=82.31 TRINITY_DN11266_c0_g1_i1:207-959(+)